MGYTAENIRNIKSSGQFDSYVDHERSLIASLEAAEFEYDKQGDGSVSVAHLYGRVGIDVDDSAYPHNAVARIVAGSGWEKKWPVANFDGDQQHALKYAKGALENELKRVRVKVLTEARSRLAALEAAAE